MFPLPFKTIALHRLAPARKWYLFLGYSAVLLYGFYWASCAAVKLPGGGPPDTTPPMLVLAEPPSGTTRFQGGDIRLVFSEYMDEDRLTKGIRVYPQLSSPPAVQFQGKELEISLPEDLLPDQTYIISLGREVTDEHGVELAAPVYLAYSTGEAIDSSRITGRVYGAIQVSLHLYSLGGGLSLDSLFQEPPDYITEATDEGTYEFNFLAPGRYQILALGRQAAGLPLDPLRMQHGIYWDSFISIGKKETVTGVNMRLHRKPEPWRLLRGNWSPQGYGQLIFNRILPLEEITAKVAIQTPARLIPETETFVDPRDRHNLIVVTRDSLPTEKVKIVVQDLRHGDTTFVDSAFITVHIPEERDTTALELSQPPQKATLKLEENRTRALELVFTKPVTVSNPDDHIRLFLQDTLKVELEVEIANPMVVKVRPVQGWQPKAKYQLFLFSQGFTAWNGTQLRDSLLTFQVGTVEPPGYGSILGSLQGAPSPGLMVEVSEVEKASKRTLVVVNSQAKFEFNALPEGRYTLMIFEDRDGDSAYTFGTAFPFQPSERFFIYPDTLQVRANWDLEVGPLPWRAGLLGKTYD